MAAFAQEGTGGYDPQNERWINLGVDHPDFGWQQVGDATWTVDGDTLACDGKPGWLFTTTQWADFQLTVEYRCLDADANSGIFIRSTLEPTDPTKDCYEINIAPADNPYPTGSVVGLVRREDANWHQGNAGDWKTLTLRVQGNRIEVSGSDGKLADLDSDKPMESGYIGLQSNGGRVEFRNVKLKPRSQEPIFNGKDLTGWNTKLGGPAEFSVTDSGELQVLGGSGQLESDSEYGDFVMQFDCKVKGDGLNSGMFFRCIPGEKMNGYECQISNAHKEGEPTVPADCGTGGIYRRVDARRIVAKDHEWFTVTINADGPHIATWVNGIQMVDWTDTRAPDENPRRGLRLKPGTFCIQAHDPTTDLLFRNLRVAELP